MDFADLAANYRAVRWRIQPLQQLGVNLSAFIYLNDVLPGQAANGDLTQAMFHGKNDADEDIAMGIMTFQFTDVTDGAEDSDIRIEQMINGTSTTRITLDGDGPVTIVGPIAFSVEDAVNSAVTDILTLTHTTTGSPAAGIGAGLAFQVEDAGGTEEHGSIDFYLTTVTDASEDCDVVFNQNIAGTIRETLHLVSNAAAATSDRLNYTAWTYETNGIVETARFVLQTLDTPVNNLGSSMSIWIEDAGGAEEQASLQFQLTDVTDGAEDCDIILNQNVNGTITQKLLLNADGLSDLAGGLEISNSATFGTTALVVDNDDTDQIAVDIQGANIDADILNISAAALTTSNVIDIPDANSLTTGIAIHAASSATAITGAGRLLYINHSGATSTSGTLAEFVTSANDETILLQLTADSLTSGTAQHLTADALTSGIGVDLTSTSTALTTNGRILRVNAGGDFNDAGGQVVEIASVHTTGTGLQLTMDAVTDGFGAFMTADALTSGAGLEIESSSTALTTNGRLLLVDSTADFNDTGGYIAEISGAFTTGRGLNVVNNAITDGFLTHINSSSTVLDTTGALLMVDHTGANTNAGLGRVVRMRTSATDATYVLSLVADSSASGGCLTMSADGLVDGGALTSTSTSAAITAGDLLRAALTTNGAAIANKTGSLATVSSSRTETGANTPSDDYDALSVSRTTISNNGGATFTATGSVARLSNTVTETLGTVNDTTDVLEIVQDVDSTGNSITIDHNPNSDVFTIDAEITTADLMNADLDAKVSGSVFDINVGTATLTASTIIYDTVVSTNHDGLGADTLVGSEVSWSGDVPNGTANSSMRLSGSIYSGTWGSGGAEGGTLDGFNANLTGATLNGSAVNAYGFHFDSTGITNTSSNELAGVKLVLDATAQAINIDAGTTDHTAGAIISADIDVNAADVQFISADINVGTLLDAAEFVYGSTFDIEGLASDADTAALVGYHAAMHEVSTGRADTTAFLADVQSVRDNADTDSGLTIGFTGTLNHSGATWYGTRVSSDTATYTDGQWYGSFINHAALASADVTGSEVRVDIAEGDNNKYGLVISKDLANTSAGAGIGQTNAALDVTSVNTNTEAQIMTVSNVLASITENNTASAAGADVYAGTIANIGYTATTDTTGTATSSATGLTVDYNLIETAGTLTLDDFNVVSIDYDSTGTPTVGDGIYNLLNINGTDAGSPAYGTVTLSGVNVDVSAIDDTDATLTLYGVQSTIPTTVGLAYTRAAGRFTDGTHTATLADGSMAVSGGGINEERYYRCFDFDDGEDGAQLDAHQTDFNVQWTVGGTNHAAANQLLQVEDNGGLELTTNGLAADSEVVTNISPIRVNSDPVFEVRFKIASVAATNAVVYMGLTETATPLTNANFEAVTDDFIMVGMDSAEANPANVRLCTDDTGGSAQTGTIDDLGVAISAGVYCTVRVDCTDTENPRVWINNTGGAITPANEIAAGSISGTIQGGISMLPVIFVEDLAGANQVLTVDYFKVWQTR
jgi:hypothetical protein